MRARRVGVALLALAAAPAAQASFHFMQIEQVIGGVNGDTTQQAIQLRMRSGGQNIVSLSRLNVFDAAGATPVLVVDLQSDVSASSGGSRVLIATAAFAAAQGITPDFLMTSAIPSGYLAAGRLTFEDDAGTIYWSLGWGGMLYTGATTGSTTNDADGQFAPVFGLALPAGGRNAVLFAGAASAPSTTNVADYSFTLGPAVFTNNAGASTVVGELVFRDGFESP